MPVSEEVPLTAFTLELKHALSAVGKESVHITASREVMLRSVLERCGQVPVNPCCAGG